MMRESGPKAAPAITDANQDRSQSNAGRVVCEASMAELTLALVAPFPFVEAFTLYERAPSPCCQRDAFDLLRRAPAGVVVGSFVVCELCGRRTTRFRVEQLLVEDPDAFDRLLRRCGVAA